jgi:hypothetical protein
MKLIYPVVLLILLTGCYPMGTVLDSYSEPISSKVPQFITVSKSKDDVWNRLINGLGSSFFVINNIDKSSGFLNLSYTGSPELYVDGGIISKTVKRSGKQNETFKFNAAKENITLIEQNDRNALFQRVRSLSLDGRINVIVTSIDSINTRITVNVKYILLLTSKYYSMDNLYLESNSESITFNTGQIATSKANVKYQSNGVLEQTIYDLVK